MWVGTNGPTVSTAVITILVLVFGEITPKSLAKQFPEKVAMYTVGFVKFVQVFTNTDYLVDARLAMDCK